MSRYFLEQLSLSFPKINVYYQPVPQTINCHLNIMDYQSATNTKTRNSYDDELTDTSMEAGLNLTLAYDHEFVFFFPP